MKAIKYDASQIQVLEGLEGVRRRPSMYIGDTNIRGLHQLVYEVIDNSVDEALAGFCSYIKVTIHKDISITVEDNGRGIPVDIHPFYKLSALELVMTKLHAGSKFDDRVYKTSGGLHGVGISVVNALSSELEVEIHREGKIYYQKYKKGKASTKLKIIGETTDINKTMTKIHFTPDPSIFEVLEFSYDLLSRRLRELAYLVKGLHIELEDERLNKKETFCYTEGLLSFMEYLNRNKTTIHKPLYWCKSKNGVDVEFALQYTDSFIESVYSYANTIYTQDGGVHLTGFRSGLTKAVNEFAKKNKLLKVSLSGEDIREGLTAIISVKLKEPQFEGQTKTKLGNTEVKGITEGIVFEGMMHNFQLYPEIAKKIVERCLITMRARETAKKAKEVASKKGFGLGNLSGKLADCVEKNPKFCELYLVEGDSASGSAKQCRDRRYQAILPLRGKILNVEKARIDKILSNEEIRNIIAAIGVGIGDNNNIELKKVRYSKIIIMTDADVDGLHIRTLLLTFFYRYMRPLIEAGIIYIACPPLYCLKKQNKEYYAYSEAEMQEILNKIGQENTFIQRYKGLGEMNPEQLWKTTMNIKNRSLLKVEIQDAIEADNIFSLLMGDKVEPRRNFIIENAKNAKNIDV